MSDLEVLGRRLHTFYSEDAAAWIQITQIRFKGHVGYVREKRRGYPGESFHMSSNERLGHKADGNRIGREVLELAIHKGLFEDAAAAVLEMDDLKREVLKGQRWSLVNAKAAWEQAASQRKR